MGFVVSGRKAFSKSILIGALALAGGCSQQNQSLRQQVMDAELGRARGSLAAAPITDKKNRQYLLQKLRTAVVTIDDGYAYPEDPQVQEVFDVLRTQGINDDKTVAAAIISDSVNFWKGEPFEQALAYHYVATHFAMLQDWGNVRAAASGALFPLKDFGKKDDGTDLATEDVAKKATWSKDSKDLPTGYVVTKTDFALGYLMNGIANERMAAITGDSARKNEANDNFREVTALNSRLEPVVTRLRDGQYNTLLFVGYGLGPMKYGRGPDNAIADFKPLTPSDDKELQVSLGGQSGTLPAVCDVNAMARGHQWKNLEDVRKAKSYLGTALLAGGAATAGYGAATGNDNAGYAGIAIMLVGIAVKASAAANIDYCEAMPQRVYVVPLNITEPSTTVTLQIQDRPETKLVLTGLSRPADKHVNVRSVRMVTVPEQVARAR